MSILRAGVIGCGNIAKYHFSGLEKAGVAVSIVCDLDLARATPWAEKFGARLTSDWHEVTGAADVDIVVVTPFSALHKPVCLAAIAAGKAVICEKTLAENADDALEIVQAAKAAGTLFYTSYMKRFIPAVQKARELLPQLGRIVSSNFRVYQCWGDQWGENPPDGFFHKPEGGKSMVVRNYGGGILVCGGSHILDLVGFFLGRPTKLYATWHTPTGRDFDVQATALMETPNGVVHYEALAHTLGSVGFLNDGWDERVEINGLDGRLEIYSAQWDKWDVKASKVVHTDRVSGDATEYRFAPTSPFDAAVGFFCTQIARGEQGSQSALTGYDVDELIAHIKKSAAAGMAVDVGYRV